jgi:hypothetical protein
LALELAAQPTPRIIGGPDLIRSKLTLNLVPEFEVTKSYFETSSPTTAIIYRT